MSALSLATIGVQCGGFKSLSQATLGVFCVGGVARKDRFNDAFNDALRRKRQRESLEAAIQEVRREESGIRNVLTLRKTSPSETPIQNIEQIARIEDELIRLIAIEQELIRLEFKHKQSIRVRMLLLVT